MKKRSRHSRGISSGTIIMLTLTALILIVFAAILPKLTGNSDIRMNAVELAVAIDQSVSELISVADKNTKNTASVQTTILPPESLTFANAKGTEATAAPVPQPTVPPTLSFTLCAAGSIQINSTVQKALTDDSGYRFSLMFDQLGSAMESDLTLATLENLVMPESKLSNTNIPVQVPPAISAAGVDALSVGYNGILDSGIDGLVQTKNQLSSAGMLPYGIYASASERSTPVITQANGISVALLHYQNDISSTGKKKTSKDERAFALAPQELDIISADITKAKQAGAQVIIVSLSWGKSGATKPTNAQKELAQGIADAGADIILGTRSGALQTVEILTANRGDSKYHPTLCAYTLGNLFTYDRDARISLASILLNAKVIYNPTTDTVAFDNLSYTPTYSWRGKDEDNVMRYRTVLNNGSYPSFVDSKQQGVMEKCYKIVTDIMNETPIAMKQ